MSKVFKTMFEKVICLLENGNAYLCKKARSKFGCFIYTRPNGNVIYSDSIVREYRIG